jgi:hypothetical protein
MAPVTWSNLPLFLMSPALLLAIAIILYRKGWVKLYPLFFFYLCARIIKNCVQFPMAFRFTQTHSFPLYRIYFYFVWYYNFALALIIYVILYRVFARSLSCYSVLRRWTFTLYMAAIAACLLLANFVMPAAMQGRGPFSIAVPLWQANMLLQVGILAFLFFFLFVFGIGISSRDYLFGIAFGFGLQSAIAVAHSALVTFAHTAGTQEWFQIANHVSDYVAIGIWFLYLFVPQRASQTSAAVDASEVSRWKETLTGFLER